MRRTRALCFAASFLVAAGLSANTYNVTTIADTGGGTIKPRRANLSGFAQP